MIRPLVLLIGLVLAAPASAQPSSRAPESIPPEVLLETIRSAYGKKQTSEEIKVTLLKGPHAPRLASDTLASDTFIVRIDPGPPGGAAPSRLLLDFGGLRVLVAGGELTAVNPAVPGRYYQTKLPGPLTPRSLAKLLPPTPVPELALACSDPASFGELTPYTPRVTWTSATIDAGARNGVLIGSSEAGPIVMTANATSGRLSKIVAAIKSPGGETTLDLTITPAEAGSPASWVIPTEGRERVKSLADLRSPPMTGPVSAGHPVPDFAPQRMDSTAWSLHHALAEPPSIPLAFILYRAAPNRLEAASRDARAAAGVVRAVQFGQSAPGVTPVKPVDLKLAGALVMDLGQFNRATFDREQRLWAEGTAVRTPDSGPIPPPELLWANAAVQSIDRIDPKAGAVLLLIAPDKTLLKVIPLDGRAGDPAALATDLRSALAPRPSP
jgi:hypothetical protein